MLTYCVLHIFQLHNKKHFEGYLFILYLTHIVESRYIHTLIQAEHLTLPFAYRHKDRIVDFKMHNDIRITSTNDRFIFIDHILYRASLSFSFAYQYTFFQFTLLTLFVLYTLYCVFTLCTQYIQSARKRY